MSTVKSVTFSSKEEQYEKLTETMGDNWKIFEGDANPLYDAYVVDTNTPSDVKSVAEDAKKIEGVSEVQDGGANTERLFQLASFIRVWGLVIAGLLIFIAVFLISNTIRITIISRSREIKICAGRSKKWLYSCTIPFRRCLDWSLGSHDSFSFGLLCL